MKEDGKIVTLKFYNSLVEAKFDLGILQENDIECKFVKGTIVGAYPVFNDQERGAEILVFEKDKKRSLEILKEVHNQQDEA